MQAQFNNSPIVPAILSAFPIWIRATRPQAGAYSAGACNMPWRSSRAFSNSPSRYTTFLANAVLSFAYLSGVLRASMSGFIASDLSCSTF
jgi:hypothetical protein